MFPFLPENVSDISDSFSYSFSILTVVKVQGRKDTKVQTCKPALSLPRHTGGESCLVGVGRSQSTDPLALTNRPPRLLGHGESVSECE